MFRQEEVFPGGWPDKTVEAMRKRRFEQSIRQMEPLDANRLETLPPGALARRLEQSWQEVKRRPMYHQQLTQVWKQVLETIDAQADGVTFRVTGYGHGVGMSQYGANQMAKEGADYRTILTHYYTGVTVEPYTTAAIG